MKKTQELSRLFEPRSVAIVGISTDKTKHGPRVLSFLKKYGFKGKIWGINPKKPKISGIKIFSSLLELPVPPDTIIVATPPETTPEIIKDAVKIKAGSAILFSGGFSENSPKGRKLQKKIQKISLDGNIRVLGPNSAGIINRSSHTVLSFLTCLERPSKEIRTGPIGLITQSGGTGSFFHNTVAEREDGIAISISTGNECDVTMEESLGYLVAHPKVKVIALVLETIRDGEKFIKYAKKALKAKKPIIVCKIGSSKSAKRVMRSHTGAISDKTETYKGVFQSLGITEVSSPQELVEISYLFAYSPIPKGNSIGIVTHSGGTAVLLADNAEKNGLSLPKIGKKIKSDLSKYLQFGGTENPLDLGGIVTHPERYTDVISSFLKDKSFDIVLAASSPHPPKHTIKRVKKIKELTENSKIPLWNLWIAGDQARQGEKFLRKNKLPISNNITTVLQNVSNLIRYNHFRGSIKYNSNPITKEIKPVIREFTKMKPYRYLSEFDSKRLIQKFGIETIQNEKGNTISEIISIATKIRYPVTIKANSSSIQHKTELRAISLDIRNEKELRIAFNRLSKRLKTKINLDGFIVEKYMPGTEVIIGAIKHNTFGSLISVGSGGVLVELTRDMQTRLAPINQNTAIEMIRELKGKKLLDGYRKRKKANIQSLAKIICKISEIIHIYKDNIEELEINPLIFSNGRWRVADCLVKLC